MSVEWAVRIEPSGSRRGDWYRAIEAMRRLAGDPAWTLPKGAVMHHPIAAGDIQVVPFGLHGGMAHTGAFSEKPVHPAWAPALGGDGGLGSLSDGGPALRETTLRRLEREFGVALVPDYRRFLAAHNGGRPQRPAFLVGGHDRGEVLDRFFGLEDADADSLLGAFDLYAARVPRGLLPIARDPFGNLILLGLSGPARGAVMFWDHEEEGPEGAEEAVTLVAESFAAFLASFREVAHGPFVALDESA